MAETSNLATSTFTQHTLRGGAISRIMDLGYHYLLLLISIPLCGPRVFYQFFSMVGVGLPKDPARVKLSFSQCKKNKKRIRLEGYS